MAIAGLNWLLLNVSGLLWLVSFVAAGYVISGFLFGGYLIACLNGLGMHWNEAFSALKIEDYKNYVRIVLTNTGLTIYPVHIEKVIKDWDVNPNAEDDQAQITPKGGGKSSIMNEIVIS